MLRPTLIFLTATFMHLLLPVHLDVPSSVGKLRRKPMVVFGGAGNVGLAVAEFMVDYMGIVTRVFDQNISRIPQKRRKEMNLIVGNITDRQMVHDAIADTEAVIIVFGKDKNLSPVTDVQEGMRYIQEGMKKHDVEKLSACLIGYGKDSLDIYTSIKFGDKWFAVFPGKITNKPATGFEIKKDGHTVEGYENQEVSKHDLAELLITGLYRPELYQGIYGIKSNDSSKNAYL